MSMKHILKISVRQHFFFHQWPFGWHYSLFGRAVPCIIGYLTSSAIQSPITSDNQTSLVSVQWFTRMPKPPLVQNHGNRLPSLGQSPACCTPWELFTHLPLQLDTERHQGWYHDSVTSVHQHAAQVPDKCK